MNKFSSITLLIICVLSVAACGPNDNDARKLGFENLDKMKELQARGFNTQKDYDDHLNALKLAAEKAAAEKAVAEKAAAEKAAAEAAALKKENEAAFPWIKSQQKLCAEYKDAPNEIKKSKIFRETVGLIQRATVNNGRGTLSSIGTNQGGSELRIKIITSDGIEFVTETVFSPIRDGSKVYKQIENLKENSCVIFSTSAIESSSFLEQSKVCDLEYFAKFTNVVPCR